jgi:hypothetical protein
MMNLVDYVERQYSKPETLTLSKDELELASKINEYFIEHKPMFRKEVLDYFGISKHMFYKLKKVNAIRVPYEISNRTYSSRNKGKVKHG